MSRADVTARALHDRFDLAAPVDVEKIAANLGIIVVRQPTDASVSGMLIRRDGRTAIGLNEGSSPASQRFTLAHLIGHHQIHAKRELVLDGTLRHEYRRLSSIPTDREEMEANRFAGAVLIPERAARRLAAEADAASTHDLTERLAFHFDVSAAVMTYRLMTLGIGMDF